MANCISGDLREYFNVDIILILWSLLPGQPQRTWHWRDQSL